ncbi:MAG: methyltransferase domain-containing protein [Bryobacter sp.]|jgi:SAM-dependent methyltransferase|nr:methyltransferase domain-containing protein [Bryobacter sp. CoA8 C33]
MNSTPAKVDSACPVCGHNGAVLVSTEDRYGDSLRTLACAQCGLYRNDPLPTVAQLKAYHEVEYRKSYKGRREPKAKNVYRSRRLAGQRLAALRRWLPAAGAVLDAGSGSGEFLAALKGAGLSPQGLEADAVYADYARRQYQVPVMDAGLLEAEFPAGAFGAITLFHVLEHQPDPIAVLERLGQWLAPGGVLVVEVPNLDSLNQHPAKRFHFAHVLGFTPASLALAAQRAGYAIQASSEANFGRDLQIILRQQAGPAPVLDTPRPLVTSGQTILAYYLRPQTYLRFLLRMKQFLGEYLATR